ncbi:MAG: hypothetical protein A2Y17_05830 [Clostridiales bacterium GWF2_38_85]|nr:MAG: hypothetical protein A2Y17_05830 [Clostridiales bacterium GWF2_38_85]HBL83998.1 hypothetical protein [Clostridiales bacterium]
MTLDHKSERWFTIILVTLFAISILICVYKINVLSEIVNQNESLISELKNQNETIENETEISIDKANKTTSFYVLKNKDLNNKLQQTYKTIAEQNQREESIYEEIKTLKNKITKLQDRISELETELQTQNVMNSYSTIRYTMSELEMLYCLVQNECGSSNIAHKRIIVDIVINRVQNHKFPNTIYDVLMQDGQFASVYTWATTDLKIDDDTIQAVNEVLSNSVVNESQGALYYYSPQYVNDKSTISWFESKVFLFEMYGHRFFR